MGPSGAGNAENVPPCELRRRRRLVMADRVEWWAAEPGEFGIDLAGLNELAACITPIVLPGEELNDTGSGKNVLDTGLGLKVTLRTGRGRSGSRSNGDLSEVDSVAVDDEALEEAMSVHMLLLQSRVSTRRA